MCTIKNKTVKINVIHSNNLLPFCNSDYDTKLNLYPDFGSYQSQDYPNALRS